MSNTNKRYTDEFKLQVVKLAESGKPLKEILSDYKISRSTLDKWRKDYSNSQSFKAKDNRSPEENELIKLRKEVAYLKMENDILKQAALILGQR